MKEVIVHDGPRTEIIESPMPKPNDDQVVIKVEVSGSNPKDWKVWWVPKPINQGDDIAGVVHEVGANVSEFRPGDRVFALHQLQAPHGSYAEYAVAWASTTCHLRRQTTFEEAATIPLAAMTAAVSLYRTLPLPQPWTPAQSPIPLIVYGASSAVGAFAVKLAKQSNIHPIIAVAGKGCDFVSTLLDTSKGDAVIDYRPGPDSLFRSIRGALAAAKVSDVGYAFDAISEHGSYEVCGKFIRPGGMLAHVLPLDDGFRLPEGATANLTMVGDVHNVFGEKPGAKDFGCTYMRAFGRGLEAGTLSGHPFEVVPGGLDGIQTGLENLKAGKASALKYLFRIGETNGLAVV